MPDTNPKINVLRPPLLDPNNSTRTASSNDSLDLTNLTQQITAIVRDILTRESQTIFPNSASRDTSNEKDQIINRNLDSDLSDLDRIPDIVKSLRQFAGEPNEFSSWKKSVDRILKIYEHLNGTPKYYGMLSIIRNKIIGNADIVLESYNTPLNWPKISKCLTMHYADKRDIGTLEYQMTTLVQGQQTIQEFYQSVYQHLSLILNKLACAEMCNESLNDMTQTYRDKALDTFIRGLKGDLPRLLSIKEPIDLPQALHLCLKLQNVDYRAQYANNSQNLHKRHVPPSLPPRQNTFQNTKTRPPFYPQLTHYPQVPHQPIFVRQFRPTPLPNFSQNFQFQNRPPFHSFNRNQWNVLQRPTPKPEPMDVDQSMQSRRVNYMNRPHQNNQPQKRTHEPSFQAHPPNKSQRVYYTATNVEDSTPPVQEDENKEEEFYDTEQMEQTFDEYVEEYDKTSYDEPENLQDIHFLD